MQYFNYSFFRLLKSRNKLLTTSHYWIFTIVLQWQTLGMNTLSCSSNFILKKLTDCLNVTVHSQWLLILTFWLPSYTRMDCHGQAHNIMTTLQVVGNSVLGFKCNQNANSTRHKVWLHKTSNKAVAQPPKQRKPTTGEEADWLMALTTNSRSTSVTKILQERVWVYSWVFPIAKPHRHPNGHKLQHSTYIHILAWVKPMKLYHSFYMVYTQLSIKFNTNRLTQK